MPYGVEKDPPKNQKVTVIASKKQSFLRGNLIKSENGFNDLINPVQNVTFLFCMMSMILVKRNDN